MKMYVLCKTQHDADKFVSRHVFAKDCIKTFCHATSVFEIINNIIQNEEEPCLLVHDNIFFNRDFLVRATDAVHSLNQINPDWGFASNYGTTCAPVGLMSSKIVKYSQTTSSGCNLSARILPAETIHGNVILLNVNRLKDKKIVFTNLYSSPFYDIILSIEAIKNGLGLYLCPHLTCFHDMHFEESKKDFYKKYNQDSISSFLEKILINNELSTIYGRLKLSTPSGKMDLRESSIKNCACLEQKKVAIVIRTQFRRRKLLERTLLTVQSFICSTDKKNNVLFKGYLVTDSGTPSDFSFDIDIIQQKFSMEDTRFPLILLALEKIDCDYIWYVDDDDWLFPNEADYLASVISCYPHNSTFYLNTRHFYEKITQDKYGDYLYDETQSKYFDSKKFIKGLSGNNFIPFCGIIFPRKRLASVVKNIEVENITYYEDYYLQLLNMLSEDFFPVIVDFLYVGISIRDEGNTVTEKDRTKWMIAKSSILFPILNRKNSILLSLGGHSEEPMSEKFDSRHSDYPENPPASLPAWKKILYCLAIIGIKHTVSKIFRKIFH